MVDVKRILGQAIEPLGSALHAWTRLLRETSTMRTEGTADEPAIFVNWHRDLLVLMIHHGERGRVFLMSQAWNMRPIARFGERIGLNLIRGATGERGPEAEARLAAALDEGHSIVLAVDGPAGPALQVRRGCVRLARQTGRPIIPVGYRALHEFQTDRRWDRMRFALPLGDLVVVYGAPICVEDDETDERAAERVHAGLAAVDPLRQS